MLAIYLSMFRNEAMIFSTGIWGGLQFFL